MQKRIFSCVQTAWMGALLLCATAALPSFAQSPYPNKPIRLVVPFTPGGVTDTSGRLIAEQLSKRLGQQVIVDNKPGASGNIGTQQVAAAAPDGYTLVLGFDGTMVINPHVFDKVPFDTLKDFAPVGKIGDAVLILVAHPGVAAKTLTEVIALSKTQAGGLSYFRQISLVLTTVTIAFAFLLVTVLLTVSVNQRVGEIAALRALGLSQRRVIADVLWESVLLVGSGALLAIPAGLVLARALDSILKAIPGVPDELHFFVYQPQALWVHGGLFAVTALLAAAYPMRLVATLPIAGTLRKEIVG